MKNIKVNLNEPVKFKLTDKGKDIYYHRFDELNDRAGYEMIKPSYPKEDKDDYTTMQLWSFMNLYGPYMKLGYGDQVIKPLEIILLEGYYECEN